MDFTTFMKDKREFNYSTTEAFLKKNKQYHTTDKNFRDVRGFKINPEMYEQMKDERDDFRTKIKREFPPEALFEFLKEHSSSTNGKRKSYILHETDDGYQLQYYLRHKLIQAGADIEEDGTEREEMQELLVRELNSRYEKTFARLPNSLKEKMLRHLIKNIIGSLQHSKRNLGGDTTTRAKEVISDVSDSALRETFDDEATLNTVLGNFTVQGKSAGLTLARVMGKTIVDKDGNEKITAGWDISSAAFKRGNITHKELEEWLRIIKNQKGAIKTKLQPITSLINSRLKTGEKVIHLEADYVIGKLNLQSMERRKDIYQYWERIGTTEYENLQSAYDELRIELRDLFQDDEIDKDLRKVIQDFYDFKPDMENGTLNYVVELSPLLTPTYSKKQKPHIIFEKFMQELELLIEEKDDSDELTEEWETFGGPDEGASKRGRDYVAVNQATGQQRDTREYDPTRGSAEKVTNRRILDPVKQTDKKGKEIPHVGFHLPGREKSNLRTAQGRKDRFTEVPSATLDIGTRELTRLGQELEEMEDIEVDPLLYHAFGKDSGPFKDVVVFERELKKITREMQSASRIGQTVTEIDVDDEIFDYINELENLLVIEEKIFHLPISDTLKNMDIGEEAEIDDKLKKVGEFLELISQFFDTGTNLSRSAGPSRAKASGDKGQPSMDTTFPGRKNRKNLLKDIQEVGEAWSNFMNAMTEFYIIPMHSKYRPFNDNIADTYKTNEKVNRVWSMLTSDKADDNAFFKFLALEASEGADLLTKDDFTEFVNLMEFIAEPDTGVDIGQLRTRLKEAKGRVSWILGANKKGDIANEVKIEFGAYFHRVLKANNQDSQDIFGKDSEEWYDMFNPDTVYPFEAMVYHIERNDLAYKDRFQGHQGLRVPKKDSIPAITQKFKSAIDSMNLGKSEYEQSLMQVHDEIRKMMGKPIYYNTGKLDNYNHVTKALDLITKKYHIELTAYELEAIVKEVNSMKELSIKHGVPEDSVYFMKANFR